MKSSLLKALKLDSLTSIELKKISIECNIDLKTLKYYNDNHIIPSGTDLEKVCDYFNISRIELMIAMGIYDSEIVDLFSTYAKEISNIIPQKTDKKLKKTKRNSPIFTTANGHLYNGDCIEILKNISSESVDLVFADPPFNLNKFYLSEINDNLSNVDYLAWSERWLDECIRVLKPGGSLFIWNIPRWNTYISKYLNERLKFRHWIVSDIKFSLPIQGKLYPSHYSLLYYCKGEKPNTFQPDRLPLETCSTCKDDIKDYGGYKNKMNPKGINLTDVWYDIPPVRHSKYKTRKEANELSLKLLDRIIEMSTKVGDVILDPFGGSGTTYIVAEIKERKWIGIELGPCIGIIERFKNIDIEKSYLVKYRENYNLLFSMKMTKERKARGLWTHHDFHENT